MTVDAKIAAFAALHQPGQPLVLVNVWDAASAVAVASAGAPALATSSWAVAAAAGYADGEALPLDKLVEMAGAVAHAVALPVSIDFEGGYAATPDELSSNARSILDQGIVGCNFEDRIVAGEGLYSITEQARRLQAVGDAAASMDRGVFINARTDLFLSNDRATHCRLVDEALERALAYRQAGASSFFVPGLEEPKLIERICRDCPLPVNVMLSDLRADLRAVAALGVARISFGPAPHLAMMQSLTDAAAGVYAR